MFNFKLLMATALLGVLSLTGCQGDNPGSQSDHKPLSDVVVPKDQFLSFPSDFMWGVATSAYQVEGAWDQGGRGLTNWDLLFQDVRMAQGATGNVAIDQYNRYQEDVALMASAGIKSYRFSIAWSRIFPTGLPFQIQLDPSTGLPLVDNEGNPQFVIDPNTQQPVSAINPEGVQHYHDLIDELIANDIEPVITLFHWDMPAGLWAPAAMGGMGGFHNRDVVMLFAAYAQAVFMQYGQKVEKWITMNEPFVYATMFEGLFSNFADELTSGETVTVDTLMARMKGLNAIDLAGPQLTFVHNYLMAHTFSVLAFNSLKAGLDPQADPFGPPQPLTLPNGDPFVAANGQIGIAFDLAVAKPGSDAPEDVAAAQLYNQLHNDLYVHPFTKGGYPPGLLERFAEHGYGINIDAGQLGVDLSMMKEASFDFAGVNYYSRNTIVADDLDPDSAFQTFMAPIFGELHEHQPGQGPSSWNGVYDPQGFYDTLMYLKNMTTDTDHPNGKSILITENGSGFVDDDLLTSDGQVHDVLRQHFVKGHIQATWKAMEDGADVMGYSYWSFADNFEWMMGYERRFGMVYIDYENDLKRIPKGSFYMYQDIISNNGLMSH